MQTVERTEEASAPARPDGAAAAEREEPGWLQLHCEVKGGSVCLPAVRVQENKGA